MAELLVDPETDVTATYAVDPARVRRLLRQVVASPGAAQETTYTPMTGAPLATFPISSRDDVEHAVAAARIAQKAWARTSLETRARLLLGFHDRVLARQSELLDIVQLESGKARRHAFEEVADCAIVARHYARRGSAYLKDARLAEAGLPDGVFQVVLGHGEPTGQAVVDLADYVCFTGSTATGRKVAEAAGRRLVSFSLELGGKNALYVAADANLARAVEEAGLIWVGPGPQAIDSLGDKVKARHIALKANALLVFAVSPAPTFANPYETKLANGLRVIVHTDIYDEFVEAFVAAVTAMRLGTGLHFGIDMGSLVSAKQLETVTRHVEDARAKGARVLAGGRARPDLGPYVYEPTVLEGVTSTMECRDQETFGPVVSLYRVASDAEAIALANDTEYGLNSSIWTRDIARGRAIAAQIQTGTVNINEGYAAAWGSVGAPMGGMKASGVGRRHGREGILKYTEAQNVTVQHVVGFGGVRGVSDEMFAKALTLSLRALKALGVK